MPGARRPPTDEAYRVTKPTRDEFGRAQNERAHEDLAEFGVGLHKGQQLRACELENLRRLWALGLSS